MNESPPIIEPSSFHQDCVDSGMNENAARIMVAALDLFADKGYAGTSVRAIVNQAQVTNPMLYYYFESKKGVFLELLGFLFESLNEVVRELLEIHNGLREQLRAVARCHFDDCRDNPQILRFVYSTLFGPASSRPDFDLLKTVENHQHLLDKAISEAIDNGNFRPTPGFDARFLSERFRGLISNHLMMVLAIHGGLESRSDSSTVDELLDVYLGEEALDRMLTFFFNGAGTFVGESS